MSGNSEESNPPRNEQKKNAALAAMQSKESRRRFLSAIGAAGVTGLAGCTGGDSSDGSESGGSDESESSGDTRLDLNVTQRFGTVDPAKGTDYTQTMALVNLYDPLVFPTPEGKIRAHLAEDWEVSEDSRSFTFTIREGATFHSGNPVRAEDVKFSLERLLAINQGWSSQFSGLVDPENVTVDGQRQITFELNDVFSPFLAALVLLYIVDKKAIMANTTDGEFGEFGDYGQEYLNNNDAGSGPYKLGELERGSYITWEQFENYWEPFPDGSFSSVRAEIIEQDSTVRSLVRSGELDMTSQYQSEETYGVLEDNDGLRVEQIPTATMFYFKMNTQKEPTSDPAVRKAISTGFDYKTARTEIAPGSEQAIGPIPELFDVHNSDIPQPEYNPEKAKQILSDAGYNDGDITITNTYVQNFDLEEKMGLLFQENMSDIGITVELQPQTWGTMTDLAATVEGTPHTNQVFFGPVKPHPDSFFFNQYHNEAQNSWMSMEHLDNAEISGLIDEARSTSDAASRGEIYREVQSKVADLYPAMFVFNQVKKHGFSNSVEGYKFRPAQSYDYWFHNYRSV